MAAPLPPLDKINPASAWQPWQPSPADPWGRKWAAHLLRRATFGASRADLLLAEKLGLQATLDLLLHGRPAAEDLDETLTDVGRVAAEQGIDQLRGWWLYCMLHSPHPLREKLTLFWHNHFATSDEKVQSAELMFRQNGLLRRHALGKFGLFLQAISKDPAMLVWLDSNRNVKGAPNENYARELMELFSLGVGNYTEKDIREAARAFTGWQATGGGFKFDARFHDDGVKTVLGKTGVFNGENVVRIVLTQPAAARFLVRKLYHFLISETVEPPAALLEPLCDSFRKSDYDIAALVRTMLSSRQFFSRHAFRQRIKSPVEFVIGAVQAVYLRCDEKDPNYAPVPQRVLVSRLAAMGQHLFAPPNVKGWPGGRAWMNTSTMLERDNFAESLALGTLWTNPPAVSTAASGGEYLPPRALDPARVLHEEKAARPEDVVRVLLDLYVPGGVRPEARTKLIAFVADGKPTGAALDRRAREVVHAILTMAEYQVG
jgi:uncharacterized protein (DUF1800 family)